jgi:hypothetical protein
MKKITGIAGIVLALAAGSAAAADYDAKISRISGNVLVSQNETYQTAREGMLLNAGDRLMVMDGGEMMLTYSDGCTSTFAERKIVQINAQSTCQGAQAVVKSVEPMYVDSAPGGVAAAEQGTILGMSTTTATVVGVGALAVGVNAYNNSNDDNPPASP